MDFQFRNRYNGIMSTKSTDVTLVRAILIELQTGLNALYGKTAPKIILYGSYARGEAEVDSDIDVLLIYAHEIRPGEEIRKVSPVLAELNLRHQVLISVLPTSQERYHNDPGVFWKNVRREGQPTSAS